MKEKEKKKGTEKLKERLKEMQEGEDEEEKVVAVTPDIQSKSDKQTTFPRSLNHFASLPNVLLGHSR